LFRYILASVWIVGIGSIISSTVDAVADADTDSLDEISCKTTAIAVPAAVVAYRR
jgi:hypothetical protein